MNSCVFWFIRFRYINERACLQYLNFVSEDLSLCFTFTDCHFLWRNFHRFSLQGVRILHIDIGAS